MKPKRRPKSRPRTRGPRSLLGPGDAFVEYLDGPAGTIVEVTRRMDAYRRTSTEQRRFDPRLEPKAHAEARERAHKATGKIMGRKNK